MVRRRLARMAVLCVVLAGWAAAAEAAGPAGAARASFTELVALRKAMQARLREKLNATHPAVLVLRAERGADTDDLELTLKQSGGQWADVHAWVPAWDQLNMGQYRQYFYSSHNVGAWQPRHRFVADAAGLSLKDGKLSGAMQVAYKLDQTLQEKLPPGKRIGWWDRFEARAYTRDRPQTYELDAAVNPKAVTVEFFLEAGLEWPPVAAADKHSPAARSILIRVEAPGTRFTPVEVRTLKWNNGKHEGLADKLNYDNGRLTGELTIMLHSDSWFPNTTKVRPASASGKAGPELSGKLLGRLPPVIATFTIDARLEGNLLTGTYKAAGDMGSYEGKIHGYGGPSVVGRYGSHGAMPDAAGTVRGMLLDDMARIDAMLPPAADLPADDAGAVKAMAAAAGELVLDVRALHLAIQAHPLPLFDAKRQMDTARPEWPADGPAGEALAEYLAAAVAGIKGAGEPDAKRPAAVEERGGSSPAGGSAAMETRGGTNVLAAKADGWQHATAWMVIGPFEQRTGFEHIEALAPDIVPAKLTPFRQWLDRSRTLQIGKAGKPGKAGGGAGEALAWTAVTADLRVMPPGMDWDNGNYGASYYATTRIASDEPRKAWVNIGTYDYAKVWLNGKLLWTETRLKSVRQRPLGRVIVQADLAKGENVLLARLDQDRRGAWLTLAVTTRDPQAEKDLPAARPSKLAAKPQPTNPPMACDIEKGTNVLWRDAKLGGRSIPLAAGERLYVGVAHDTLACLDAATGKQLWSQRVATYDAAAEAVYQKVVTAADERAAYDAGNQLAAKLGLHRAVDSRHLVASTPVQTGEAVVFATATGEVVAFDRSGKELWRKSTGLAVPSVKHFDGVIVVQGCAGKGWAALDDEINLPPNSNRAPTGVVMLKADGSGEIGRFSTNRKREDGLFVQPRGSDKVYYVANAFVLLDLTTCKPSLKIDVFCPLEQSVCASDDTIYLTSLGFAKAIFVYAQPDGKLAWRETWEGNTDRKWYMDAPGIVHNGMLWWWNHIVDHGPHCADRHSALYVADATTGSTAIRVKPILNETVGSYAPPTPAGEYLCFLAGGGHSFGNGDASRMAMVATDGTFFVAQPEMKLEFSALPPVFSGDRLFVRTRRSLTCVAVKGEEGRAFQARQLAAQLFNWIGPEPLQGKQPLVEPAKNLAIGSDLPLGEFRTYPTEYWLGAGPFAPGAEAEADLASLRPRAGTTVRLKDASVTFSALPPSQAGNVPPSFSRQCELQGTGDSMPAFDAFLDPRACSGKEYSGLFYTVLNNTVQRVMKPAWFEDKMRGITVWVGGYKLQKDEAMLLKPGLYPVLIKIDPEFYDRGIRTDEMPIDVRKALADKKADAFTLTRTWRVLGPLPNDVPTLPAETLAAMPGATVKVGDGEFDVHDIPAMDAMLKLTGLFSYTKGVPQDWTKAPDQVDVASPFTAYCFAQIDAPADGTLYVNAGADWFMRWYVDGSGVLDTIQTGNGRAPADMQHGIEVPLKKGKHVIAVMIRPGTKGWSLHSTAAFSTRPKAELKDYALPAVKKEFDFRFRPYFDEVPNGDVMAASWAQRLKAVEPRLEQVLRDLPGSPEAATAQSLLAKLEGIKKAK